MVGRAGIYEQQGGTLKGNVIDFMKQTRALESHIFVIRENLNELTSFMKALMPSFGISFLARQYLPIQKWSMDGWPIVGDGSGKVGIVDSKAHECNMDKGHLVGDGSGKVGVDNKVVGAGGDWQIW